MRNFFKFVLIVGAANVSFFNQAHANIFDSLIREDRNFTCNVKVNKWTDRVIDSQTEIINIIDGMKDRDLDSAKTSLKNKITGIKYTGAQKTTSEVLEIDFLRSEEAKKEKTLLTNAQLPIGWNYSTFFFDVKVQKVTESFEKKSENEIKEETCNAVIKCASTVKTRGQKKAYDKIKANACN